MQAPRHVTMIDDLPNLEDLEQMGEPSFPPHGAGLPPGTRDNYDKFIRPNHRMNPSAGMMGMEHYNNVSEGYGPAPPNSQYGTMYMDQGGPPQPQQGGPLPPQPPQPPQPFINCIDIAKHVQECPICSKFYKNDTTVYIICIIILAIVCLLLLKRVLNV